MASPTAEPALQNGVSTPPATTAGNTAGSPPTQTQSSTQPNTQSAPSFSAPLAETTGKKPRDARLIHLLLAQMGVHVYNERVPLQLLDFAYRYTSSILSDAQSYEPPQPSNPSGVGKKRRNADTEGEGEGVSMNALRTAVAARSQGQFQAWLPKEFMGEVAQERNRVALPRVDREFGVRLPPERYCFTGAGWGIRERWEEEVEEEDDEEGMDVDGGAGGVGFGGPVGGGEGEVEMGGMGEDMGDVDEDEFEDAMGN